MSDLNVASPKGVLRRGWSAAVGDYAIAGGWYLRGEALMVAWLCGRFREILSAHARCCANASSSIYWAWLSRNPN